MKKKKFNIFDFSFGKEKKSLKESIKIGSILHFSLDIIALVPGFEKKQVFNFIDNLQQKMGTIDVLNDYIIQDSELLSYRIDRVVSKSISEYERDNV